MSDRKLSKATKPGGSEVKVTAPRPVRIRQPKPVDAATREEIFRRFQAANPEPRGELEHSDPYTLLVAVVLSAQATDKGVNIATRELFRAASTPAAMVALGEERVTELIRTIGLYRNKAKNVVALSRILVEQHGGVVPPARAVLEALPGVGPKTASVVLNIAFGEPTIAVDTHVFRVSHRIPLVIAKTPDDVQRGLERIVPSAYLRHAHHWLILHGRYICKARRPECARCLIQDLCRYPAKTL
jgi:endonuclease-3